ncbi:MAG: TldD/PmbA family protein [Deltaproteobacteria bacterium]|nr:MAG: TldD/PmbA family protein [Deltaproteobacteria bacterium]
MLKDLNIVKILKTALGKGGDLAEIFGEEVTNTSVVCEDSKIEKVVCGTDRGVGIRVLFQEKTAYAYSNDLSEKGLIELARGVSQAVQGEQFTKDIDLRKSTSALSFPIKKPPQDSELSQKVAYVNQANSTARSFDPRIQQAQVTYRDTVRKIAIANSLGNWVEDEQIRTVFLVRVVAREDETIQSGYEPAGGLLGLEIFDTDPPEEIALRAARRGILMLTSPRAPAGTMPVVLGSEAGGTMIHEAIGHGLEADHTQRGLSVYAGKVGEQVASPLITVVDDATLPRKQGSFVFDDEGTPAQKTVLVKDGVLQGYLYDLLTSMKESVASTGNGRRESYHFRPFPRMTNTFIAPGNSDPEEVIRSTERGLFVKKMGGGEVNTVNGDFVFEVSEGYLIEKGKVGEAVRGATLTGNGPRVLREIDMVGNDLGFAVGACGKEGQRVPVGDAQPTLRIPGIIVGGEI